MTDSEPHHPPLDDAQASLRAELLDQLLASQSAIEAALADFAGADPTVREQLRAQLSTISGLRQQIGTASIATLNSLQTQVMALAGIASAAANEAQASAQTGSSSPMGMALYASNVRQEVNAVMAGMKDFDRYLQFDPGDTEADYRQREAERRAYIAAQQAKHTPEGDLNASGAAIGQMADAKAHGAGDSPEFQQRWDKLVTSTEVLRAEIVRNGGSTKEFDERLRNEMRRVLKSKGLSDAQIDAQFAAHPDNPLEAAKAYVSERDLETIVRSTPAVETAPQPAKPVPLVTSAEDAMAKFRAAGIVTAEHSPGDQFAHGISRADNVPPQARTV